MAITTTGGSGNYTKLGGTTVTLFTTPNTANAIFIVDIVETTATQGAEQTNSRVYTLRVGPNTAVKISDDTINDIVCYSWVGIVIT